MRTGKKVLVVTASLVMAGVIVGLMVMRNFAREWIRKTESLSNYKAVAIGHFERLDFSNNWEVRIKQGSDYKVELAVEDSLALTPKLENIAGTLYFTSVGLDSIEHTGRIYAKITTPLLMRIKGGRHTTINLEYFTSDSLHIILEDGGAYTGYNNSIKYVTVKTSGEVSLKLTADEELLP